jgi:hypothetical protein
LSGITCLLVAMPGVATPDAAFLRAIDRIEDVVVGVCSLIFIDTLLFPQSGLAKASAVTRDWLDSLRKVTAGVLRGEAVDHALQSGIVRQTIQLTPLSDGMSYEGASYGWERAHALMAVVTRGLRLMPVLSSVGDFDRESGKDEAHPADIETRDLLAQWIEAGCPDDARSADLRARLRPRAATGLLDRAAAVRLCYRRYLRGIYAGWRYIERDHTQIDEDLPKRVHVPAGARTTPATIKQVDLRCALRACLCVSVHMLLFGSLWSATGWDDNMAFGMLLSAIFVSLSALVSAPLPILKGIAKVTGIGMMIVSAYVIFVLPAVSSFQVLALALLPALFLLGLEILKAGGVLFAILPMAMLRIGADGPGVTVDTLLCSVIAMYLGIASAMIANILVPQPPLVTSVRRLVRRSVKGVVSVIDDGRADARHLGYDDLDSFLLIQASLPQIEHDLPGQPGWQTLRASRMSGGMSTLRRWAGSVAQRRALLSPVSRALRESLSRWGGPGALLPASSLDAALDTAFDGIGQESARHADDIQAARVLVEIRVAFASMNRTAVEEA